MGQRVEVNRGVGRRVGVRTNVTLNDVGVAEVGSVFDAARKLRRELSEAEVLTVFAYEVERRGIPKARSATIAEQHFVAVGQREQRRETVSNFADLVSYGRLAVGGTHVGRRVAGECRHLLRAHFGWSGAEASVAR